MTYRYNRNNVCITDYAGFMNRAANALQPSPYFPDKYVLAEGDSWFHIGGLNGAGNARNLLDEITINDKQALLLNMALTGDTVRRISESFKSERFKMVLANYKWDLILLSAGGNDLIDALTDDLDYVVNGNVLSIIQSATDNNNFMSYINEEDLKILLEFLTKRYTELFAYINTTQNKHVPIFIHTYDYPTPRNAPADVFIFKKGAWLIQAFKRKKVPDTYWVEITDHIFNTLALALLKLSNNNIHVVKTHGTLTRADKVEGNSNDWLNEIHPNSTGLEKLAKKINAKIKQEVS